MIAFGFSFIGSGREIEGLRKENLTVSNQTLVQAELKLEEVRTKTVAALEIIEEQLRKLFRLCEK